MTNAEIVAEYRQAAKPQRQIEILADENMCTNKEIVEILREAGCELPKIYLPKKKVQAAETEAAAKTEEAAEPAAAEVTTEAPKDAEVQDRDRYHRLPAELDELMNIIVRTSAVDAIANLLVKGDKDDPDGTYDFREQVRGVLMLVREIELR